MARRLRYFPDNIPVHVIQRGNNRQNCFISDQDKKALAHWLHEGVERYGVAIHAWVFMTNHLHLLATPENQDSIPRMMQHLGRTYVPYFNRKYERTGGLFEGRYYHHPVQTNNHFLNCSKYIELNPVRAGMVSSPGNYSWSSFCCHAFGAEANLWKAHLLYEQLGNSKSERQKAYRTLFNDGLHPDVLDSIRSAARTGFAFGDNGFRGEIERLTGVTQSPRKRGRPPKR